MPRLLCPWDLQARILEWIAIHASRGSSNLKIKPTSLMCPALAGRFFTTRATWEAKVAITYENRAIYHINRTNGKNHMIKNTI